MSNYITYEERMEVENCLFNGKSFGEIAKNSEKTVLLFPEKSENTLLLNAPVMEQTVTMLVCIGRLHQSSRMQRELFPSIAEIL